MAIFKCKMCGGDLEVDEWRKICECEYCGTQQTLPRLDSEKKINLYARANHFRRNNEYDKAMAIYESILNEDTTDAEAYWSIVLCKYGIEYVEDPITKKRIATCNRTQFGSVLVDEDYKKALEYSDELQRKVYEQEAKVIDQIQKEILAISSKEKPFDIFICYKETDNHGRRTQDSVLAQDLYYQLTNEGFKVFFARITLEDKLGQAYEPYIFSALNSSKVMVVVGTRPEHFDAVWVKNEWSRYLALIKAGADKVIIPAYKDMDPYDIPEAFSHLQAQDMSKLGFMQDLIRGIKKICVSEMDEVQATEIKYGADEPLIRRARILIEDGEIKKADELLEQALNINPENATTYITKLIIDLGLKREEELPAQLQRFNENANYIKAMRFATEEYRQKIGGYDVSVEKNIRNKIEEQNYELYECLNKEEAGAGNNTDVLYKLSKQFLMLGNYKDSKEKSEVLKRRADDLLYLNLSEKVKTAKKAGDLEYLSQQFALLGDYKDAEMLSSKYSKMATRKIIVSITTFMLVMCLIFCAIIIVLGNLPRWNYEKAVKYQSELKLYDAMKLYEAAGEYEDSKEKVELLSNELNIYYQDVKEMCEAEDYTNAYAVLLQLGDFEDCEKLMGDVEKKIGEKYEQAELLFKEKKYALAEEIFITIPNYKKSDEYIKKCNDCSIVGHDWYKEKCSEDSVCIRCDESKMDAMKCEYGGDGTCTNPIICNVCNDVLVTGEHQWNSATCTQAKTCVYCGVTEGTPVDHDRTQDRICKMCGESCYLLDESIEGYLEVWTENSAYLYCMLYCPYGIKYQYIYSDGSLSEWYEVMEMLEGGDQILLGCPKNARVYVTLNR